MQAVVCLVLLAIVIAFGAFPQQIHSPSSAPTLQATRLSLPGIAAAVPAQGPTELVAQSSLRTVLAAPAEDISARDVQDRTVESAASLLEQQEASALPATIESNEGTEVMFFRHEVQPGETVSGIAERFGVSTQTITWNNIDILDDENALPAGITLQIPAVDGIIHPVRVGETVSDIAQRYDASVDDIVNFRANGLGGDPDNLREGEQILVPGGRVVPLAPATRPDAPPDVQPEPGPAPPADAPAIPAPDVQPGGWSWPAVGQITSYFGPMHPLGIDIMLPSGTPIHAASGGHVTFVGGDACCSYGYYIIIDHGGGMETLYAHLSDFAVGNGEFVEAGQVIGYSGNTGRSTGPHLHFEIRANGIHQDPLGYLR